MKKQLLIFCFVIAVWQTAMAQTFTLDPQSSTLKVNGTSSLHAWEMTAGEISGTIQTTVLETQIESIQDLKLMVVVKSLDGGKKGMNKDAYEALKAEIHEYIIFKFLNLQDVSCTSEICDLKINGILTVAGTKKNIEISCDATVSESTITISGSKALKMTDYNVKPPKALLGLIKADDDVQVIFDLVFKRGT